MKKEKKEKKIKEKKAKRPASEAAKASSDGQPDEPAPARPVKAKALRMEPLSYALSVIGGKWKLRILWVLSKQKGRRYGDIKRDVPEITDMMLSQSLKELTAEGLVERTQYQEIPPRVEYAITARGREVLPAIEALIQWSEKRMEEQTDGN